METFFLESLAGIAFIQAVVILNMRRSRASLDTCPFCGNSVDVTDRDTLYPSGVCWRYMSSIESREYFQRSGTKVPDGACWNLRCQYGAEIHGDSRANAIYKWRSRVTPR